MRPKESAESLSPTEIRRRALEMLRSRKCEALSEVEKLLGWEQPICMPASLMSQQLGITRGQLRYMLFRDELQKEAKEKRIAEKEARNIEYTTYASMKLKFSISFPAEWRVNTDKLEAEPGPSWEQASEAFQHIFPDSAMTMEEFKQQAKQQKRQISAEEAYQRLLEEERTKAIKFKEFKRIYERDRKRAYSMFFENLLGMPPDEGIEALAVRQLPAVQAYRGLMEDPETFLISFPEFKERYQWDQEQQRAEERRRVELAQMEEGYFEASPPDDEDYPSVEVTKIKLTRLMTPLGLYQLDKPSLEAVPWGNRPSKGITVDGLQGIKYYYIFDTGETRNMTEMPQFFNVYLTENEVGWIISCSCKKRVFRNYKVIFAHIISSFRRT